MRAKKDSNHDALVAAMRDVKIHVIETHRAGGACLPGFPDAVCAYRGVGVFVEIKAVGKRISFTPDEINFIAANARQMPIVVVQTLDDVLTAFKELKRDIRWRQRIIRQILQNHAKDGAAAEHGKYVT